MKTLIEKHKIEVEKRWRTVGVGKIKDLEDLLKHKIEKSGKSGKEYLFITKNGTIFKNNSKREALKDIATVNGYRTIYGSR